MSTSDGVASLSSCGWLPRHFRNATPVVNHVWPLQATPPRVSHPRATMRSVRAKSSNSGKASPPTRVVGGPPPWLRPTSGDLRWLLSRPVMLSSVGHAEGTVGVTNDDSVSQAENAGSIPVVRSRLDFVATTHEVVTNVAVGFRHYSRLSAPVHHFALSQDCVRCKGRFLMRSDPVSAGVDRLRHRSPLMIVDRRRVSARVAPVGRQQPYRFKCHEP